jgi:hypothetical protein
MINNSQTQPAVNYSTEEQAVGTWVDGKPLYQKTIEQSGLSIPGNGSDYRTIILDDTISEIVDLEGSCWIGENVWLPLNFYQGDANYIFCYYDSGKIVFVVRGWPVYTLRITIKYVKSTD